MDKIRVPYSQNHTNVTQALDIVTAMSCLENRFRKLVLLPSSGTSMKLTFWTRYMVQFGVTMVAEIGYSNTVDPTDEFHSFI